MSENNNSQAAMPNGARSRNMLLATLISSAVLAAAGGYYLLANPHLETTDNAYVNGHIVAVTPQTEGAVTAILADNADRVKAGDRLVEIDKTDADIALSGAKAALAQARQSVEGVFARKIQTAADIQLRSALLARAQADADARRGLAQQGAIPAEEIRHAQDTVKSAKAALMAAEAADAQAQAAIEGTTPDTHPQILLAQARLHSAEVNQTRTTLRAPVSGMIAQRTVQLGKRVAVGEKLMAVVPLDQMWVDANFKEIQLANICRGQTVTVTVDAWGDRVIYHGHVQDIMAGSGAAFALLPAQNATGNWIKVVQRIPVRISLDAQEISRHPLRIGMSAEVSVNTARCGVDAATGQRRGQ